MCCWGRGGGLNQRVVGGGGGFERIKDADESDECGRGLTVAGTGLIYIWTFEYGRSKWCTERLHCERMQTLSHHCRECCMG